MVSAKPPSDKRYLSHQSIFIITLIQTVAHWKAINKACSDCRQTKPVDIETKLERWDLRPFFAFLLPQNYLIFLPHFYPPISFLALVDRQKIDTGLTPVRIDSHYAHLGSKNRYPQSPTLLSNIIKTRV